MIRIESHAIKSNARKYADICKSTWSPIIQSSQVGYEYWQSLFEYFPDYQLIYENENGEWIGFANTIPLNYNRSLENLPDSGWDWLIAKGHNDYESHLIPNMLGGLQIGVHQNYRGKGYSTIFLQKAKELQKLKRLKSFILPIRPTMKHLHPEIDMKDYINWQKEGKIYDPWIRTHLKNGAKIIKVCSEAMRVEGSIEDWENWTEKKFVESGQYAIEGGLSMVDINIEQDMGRYLEPNIWISYQ